MVGPSDPLARLQSEEALNHHLQELRNQRIWGEGVGSDSMGRGCLSFTEQEGLASHSPALPLYMYVSQKRSLKRWE